MTDKIKQNPTNPKSQNTKKQIIGNYRIEKTIGEGTFGKVKLGIHIPTEEQVAIKILEKDKIQDEEDLERISREISILKKLKHPNIIKIYDIIENPNNFYIIMELAINGELFKHIVKKKHLEENEASFFFCQLISALETIHKEGIVHRDIKPENLLLKENNILTIIDFGLSNKYNKNQLLETPCGSPCYAAPEMILGKKYNCLLVDLWSSGIVLYAMVCGYLPFEDKNNEKLYKKILSGKFELPNRLSHDCKDLIKKILTVNPKNRIGIEGIKNHPFLIQSFNNYHIDEFYISYDKGKLCDVVIDKMVSNFNYKKEDIIFNLENNKHNNITATYELLLKKYKQGISMATSNASIGLNSITSSTSVATNSTVKNEEKKKSDKNIIKKEEKKDNNINNNSNKKESSFNNKNKSSNSKNNSRINSHNKNKNKKRFRNSFYSGSDTKTIDYNNSNHSYKNDFSGSIDMSKIVNKNKIDSNIIIGTPKLVSVNKNLFQNKNRIIKYPNKSKKNPTSREYYSVKYKKKQNQNLSKNKSKNSEINTSVSFEKSDIDYSNIKNNNKKKNKSKNIIYIPSNTINLMDIMSSNNSLSKASNASSQNSFFNNYDNNTVNHYSSFNDTLNNSKNDSIELYPRSQSNYIYINDNNKKDIMNKSYNYSNSNSTKQYLLTFNEDSNLYLNKTVSNRSKISNTSLSSLNSKYSYNNMESKNKVSRAIRIESSFPKTQILQKKSHQIYFHKKNCKSNINDKINNYNYNNKKNVQSPNHKNNNSSTYCHSYTETNSISNNSPSIKKNKITSSNPTKVNNEISITIKKDYSNKQINKNNHDKNSKKNNTVINNNKKTINSIRAVSPVNLYSKFNETNNMLKNKQKSKINSISQKPNIVDIDITINTKPKKTNEENINSSQIKKGKNTNNKHKKQTHNKNNNNNNNNNNSHRKNSTKNLNKQTLQKNSKKNLEQKKNILNKPKIQPVEIQFDLEAEMEMKNKIITTKKDFALCTTNSSLEEINDKLTLLCIDNGLTLTKVDTMKYICKKDSDNSINIEVSVVGKSNALKLYHLNGQESITKEIIRNIIITLAF